MPTYALLLTTSTPSLLPFSPQRGLKKNPWGQGAAPSTTPDNSHSNTDTALQQVNYTATAVLNEHTINLLIIPLSAPYTYWEIGSMTVRSLQQATCPAHLSGSPFRTRPQIGTSPSSSPQPRGILRLRVWPHRSHAALCRLLHCAASTERFGVGLGQHHAGELRFH